MVDIEFKYVYFNLDNALYCQSFVKKLQNYQKFDSTCDF